jgi:O-acetyl-ADP-ribose deacetylase (regulator of RNase III)
MIEVTQGNLLHAKAEAIVNTVNTVGVMGKGIALQFKYKYPNNFKAYAKAHKAGDLKIGKMFTFDLGALSQPRFIINFPTKQHWRAVSKLEYIDAGLADLIQEIKRLDIRSVALPALGCSNGGLKWRDVKPRITRAFAALPEVRVLLFAPLEEDEMRSLETTAKKPNLTLGRALILKLIDFYHEPGYELGKLEAQKLAYFLQVAGQDLKLTFVKHLYGPYADNVNHVLEKLEGHYIKGYGDRSSKSKINLLPNVINEVNDVLATQDEALSRLNKVKSLIEGFETPYGMELLASVHWLIKEDSSDFETVKTQLQDWNPRKAQMFDDNAIHIALEHLREQGWLPS